MKKYSVDPKIFWEEKILKWEEGRYFLKRGDKHSLLESSANFLSNSLRFRMKMAMDLLRPHIEGKRVVELGCGSGLLTKLIIDAKVQSYLGIDITESAINLARQRSQINGIKAKASFQIGSINSLPLPPADIYFSLGLLDWLTDDQLSFLFTNTMKADFLHSFSEKRISLSQSLHRFYAQLAYGKRTGAYIPRYFSVDEIKRLSIKKNQRSFFIIRNSKLNFAAIMTSLPEKERSNANHYSVCR